MAVTNYDLDHLDEILNKNHGDWFTAHTLRYVSKVLFKADTNNRTVLVRNWPDVVVAIYRYNGWSDESIYEKMWDGNLIFKLKDWIAEQPRPTDKFKD